MSDAGYEDIEARGRWAGKYWDSYIDDGKPSLITLLTDALADMRRQRDEARALAKLHAEASDALRDAAQDEVERLTAERDRYKAGLEIIAGLRQCADNPMSNIEVARDALRQGEDQCAG
jgi:hypothetical protein